MPRKDPEARKAWYRHYNKTRRADKTRKQREARRRERERIGSEKHYHNVSKGHTAHKDADGTTQKLLRAWGVTPSEPPCRRSVLKYE